MVKGWRHELQRVFLSKSGTIKPEVRLHFPSTPSLFPLTPHFGSQDMEKASANLKTVEDYGPKMTLPLLSSSKIGMFPLSLSSTPSQC